MWLALGKTVVWTKLQLPIHIFCNYKWDTIDFYLPKWEADDKGDVIVKSHLSSETYIYSNWYFTFLKQRSFFLIQTMKSRTKILYRLKQKSLCTCNDTCLDQSFSKEWGAGQRDLLESWSGIAGFSTTYGTNPFSRSSPCTTTLYPKHRQFKSH